jgi:two-component system, LytTR family, sensor kinase
MNHPFFNNRKLVTIYISIWIAVAAIHVFILQYIYPISTETALLDSIVFNTIFALFGIPVWYVVAYTKPGKFSVINQVINHVTSLTIIMIIWIMAGNGVLRGFISTEESSLYIEASLTWRIISGLFFYSIMVLIYYIIIYYNDLQERVSREAKLNEIVKQAELDNLRSQINPHFLFNSLNSISSLTITSPEKAQEMIIKLSDFLRYSISQSNENISTLKMELDNIRRYLDIEQVRFGSKIIQEYNISDDCLAKEVPAMLLQPLYENAVKHAVYESTEPIRILTTCRMQNNDLVLTITNNFDPDARSRKGSGIGLKNIKERLSLIYGGAAIFKTKTDGLIFTAEIFIPQKVI